MSAFELQPKTDEKQQHMKYVQLRIVHLQHYINVITHIQVSYHCLMLHCVSLALLVRNKDIPLIPLLPWMLSIVDINLEKFERCLNLFFEIM